MTSQTEIQTKHEIQIKNLIDKYPILSSCINKIEVVKFFPEVVKMTTQTEIQTKLEIQIQKLISLIGKVEKDGDRRDDLKWDIQEIVETLSLNNMKRPLETIMWDKYYRRFPNSVKCRKEEENAIKDFCQDFKIYRYTSLEIDEIKERQLKRKDELKERQLKRKLLVQTLPPEIWALWQGRTKLSRFICYCGGWLTREISCEDDEYRAMRFVLIHYNDISKADLKTHGNKWLYQFIHDFGCHNLREPQYN